MPAVDLDTCTENFPKNNMKPGEISLGTTIMAFEFAEGVVLCADSRTSAGTFISCRASDKISKLTEKIYCCRSGSAADTQAVADIVRYVLELNEIQDNKNSNVRTAAALFRQICYTNKNMLTAGIIVAGYDDEEGPAVYSIPLGGSIHRQKLAIGGSGSQYIYGYCDANFREKMPRDKAIDFAKNAAALAMSRDNSSGGVIRLVIITSTGVERILVPGDQLPAFYVEQ